MPELSGFASSARCRCPAAAGPPSEVPRAAAAEWLGVQFHGRSSESYLDVGRLAQEQSVAVAELAILVKGLAKRPHDPQSGVSGMSQRGGFSPFGATARSREKRPFLDGIMSHSRIP
jgi:hypothetical protein